MEEELAGIDQEDEEPVTVVKEKQLGPKELTEQYARKYYEKYYPGKKYTVYKDKVFEF